MYTLFQDVKALLEADTKLYELIGETNQLIWQTAVDFAEWPCTDFWKVLGTSSIAIGALSFLSKKQIDSVAFNGIPLFRYRVDNDFASHISMHTNADKLVENFKRLIAEELRFERIEDLSATIERLLGSQTIRIDAINKAIWDILCHLRENEDPLARERFDIEHAHLKALMLLSEYEFHVLSSAHLPVFKLELVLDGMFPSRKKEKRYVPLDHMLFMLGKSIKGDMR